jgi:hypothetical protein
VSRLTDSHTDCHSYAMLLPFNYHNEQKRHKQLLLFQADCCCCCCCSRRAAAAAAAAVLALTARSTMVREVQLVRSSCPVKSLARRVRVASAPPGSGHSWFPSWPCRKLNSRSSCCRFLSPPRLLGTVPIRSKEAAAAAVAGLTRVEQVC